MKKYKFYPYNPNYPTLFELEKKRISNAIPIVLDIQHIGSTSIPGLGGKCIIDIAIAVKKEDLIRTTNELEILSYIYWEAGSTSERLFFKTEPLIYHTHLTFPECREWKDLLGFRDYLKNHPDALDEYSHLKKSAALEANEDGAKYRLKKDPFIKNILRKLNN